MRTKGFLTAKSAENAKTKDLKDGKDLKDRFCGLSDLHFYFSCSAVLARMRFEKKLTVMFYVEPLGGGALILQIFGKKG